MDRTINLGFTTKRMEKIEEKGIGGKKMSTP